MTDFESSTMFLCGGGKVHLEAVEVEPTERRISLILEGDNDQTKELFLELHEATNLGLDLMVLAREYGYKTEEELAEQPGTEWEYEPNREALAVEARVEPEGRWGDE